MGSCVCHSQVGMIDRHGLSGPDRSLTTGVPKSEANATGAPLLCYILYILLLYVILLYNILLIVVCFSFLQGRNINSNAKFARFHRSSIWLCGLERATDLVMINMSLQL